MNRVALLVLLAALGGCGGGTTVVQPTTLAEEARPDGAAILRAAEERLLGSRRIELRAAVFAEGRVDAALDGDLVLGEDGATRLDFVGVLEGRRCMPWLLGDERRVLGGPSPDQNPAYVSAGTQALREALVLGFTRMGVLHNLARLARGEGPDHSSGGASDWVQAANVRTAPPSERGGLAVDPLFYDVMLDGERVGEAVLWLDARTGLPVERSQVMRFDRGAIRVRELYLELRLDDEVDQEELNLQPAPKEEELEGS